MYILFFRDMLISQEPPLHTYECLFMPLHKAELL